MACVYPYDDSADGLYRSAKGLRAEHFFQQWTPGDVVEDHLLCAEMSRLAYASEPVVTEALGRVRFRKRGWFGGARFSERFAAWGTDGFVATGEGGRTVIAFRGTESDRPEDLLADMLVTQTARPDGTRVHEGFAAALERVRAPIEAALRGRPTGPLLVTGHSLGAALATLLAAERREERPALVTFGSPRVGDAAFARLFAGSGVRVARFVNCCDVVTRIPPERFDHDSIAGLLADLTGQPALSGAAAAVLSQLLPRIGISPEFADVGPARYVSAEGVHREGAVPDVAGDRAQARARYRAAHGALPPVDISPHGLGGIGALTGGGLGALAGRLVGAVAGDTVPIRDLADHAPINYVSAMVRSFRSESAPSCPLPRRQV